MNVNLVNLIQKYQDLKKSNDIKEIEKISLLLNNEMMYLVKEEIPEFITAYEELLEKSENKIARGYKFELKQGKFHIYSPHSPRKNKSRSLLDPHKLYEFLIEDPENLSSQRKELALLLLSNSNSILALNMAINLF